MMGWLGKNVRHHSLLAAKKIKNWLKSSKAIPKNEIWIRKQMIQNLLFGVVYKSINFRFSGRFSKPTKTSYKDLSHNNTVSVGRLGG